MTISILEAQEQKLKQFGNILYEFIGPAADQITGKPEITLAALTHDVTIADAHTKEYHEKLINLQTMARELGLLPLTSPQAPITDRKTTTDTSSSSSFVNTNPYANPYANS